MQRAASNTQSAASPSSASASPSASPSTGASSSPRKSASPTPSASAGVDDMDYLNELLHDDPPVPDSASERDKEILTPLMERFDQLNVEGLRLSHKDPDEIKQYYTLMAGYVSKFYKEKGAEPGDDVVTYTQVFGFFANSEGQSLNVEAFNADIRGVVPLVDYLHFSEEMTPVEVAGAHLAWAALLHVTYSFTGDDGKKPPVVLTSPVLREGSYEVVDENKVLIHKTQFTTVAKDNGLPLVKGDREYPRMTFVKVDGVWKIDALSFVKEMDLVLADYEAYERSR